MADIREIYKKERITAEEVHNIIDPRQRTAIILDYSEGLRKYQEQEYKFVILKVQFKAQNRTIHLSYNNAEQIARVKGYDPEAWKNTAILLNAIPDDKGYKKLQVFVSQTQV